MALSYEWDHEEPVSSHTLKTDADHLRTLHKAITERMLSGGHVWEETSTLIGDAGLLKCGSQKLRAAVATANTLQPFFDSTASPSAVAILTITDSGGTPASTYKFGDGIDASDPYTLQAQTGHFGDLKLSYKALTTTHAILTETNSVFNFTVAADSVCTLPAIGAAFDQVVYWIKNDGASTAGKLVTMTPQAGEAVEGTADETVILWPGEAVVVQCESAVGWHILATYKVPAVPVAAHDLTYTMTAGYADVVTVAFTPRHTGNVVVSAGGMVHTVDVSETVGAKLLRDAVELQQFDVLTTDAFSGQGSSGFAVSDIDTGLTIGTAYTFKLQLLDSGATGTAIDTHIIVHEV